MEAPDSPNAAKADDRNHPACTSFMISDILHSTPRNRSGSDADVEDVLGATDSSVDSTEDGDQSKPDDTTCEEELLKSAETASPGRKLHHCHTSVIKSKHVSCTIRSE